MTRPSGAPGRPRGSAGERTLRGCALSGRALSRRVPCALVSAASLLSGSVGCGGSFGKPELEAPRPGTEPVTVPLADDARSSAEEAARGEGSDPTLLCDRVLDDFSRGAEGSFPEGWETHPGSGLEVAQREGLYRVVEHEGRRVLHARSGSSEVSLGLGVKDWDLQRYPVLEWEWKPVTLPEGADESRSGRSDAAASVTAVWMIGLPFVVRRLSYSYSSALPVGSRVSSRFGYDRTLVVGSGAQHRGKWRRVRVNVLEDYRALFDRKDADAPTGIALTTDAGDTGSRAEAYYANLRLCRPSPGTEGRPSETPNGSESQ